MPCKECMIDPLKGMCLGYSYVPIQEFENIYCAEKALKRGTIFADLDLPLGVYGNNFNHSKGERWKEARCDE